MKLVTYVDESGTDGNSEVLIIGGFIALREEWASFSKDWQSVLDDHKAKYFHFREWADASAVIRKKRQPNSGFEKNPYKSWKQDKLDRFLLELAEVAASDGRLVVGGYVPRNKLREDQANGLVDTKSSAEELCVSHFFDSVVSTIVRERRVLRRQSISFFFDHSTDQRWRSIVNAGYDLSCQKHRQFKANTIVSKGLRERVKACDVEFLPLQAADMVAYRMRQKMEKLVNFDFDGPQWDKLDNILFKSLNQWGSRLDEKEQEAVLRRVFVVPQNATYEETMNAIATESIIRHANKIK